MSRLRQDYAAGFVRYLSQRDEAALSAAYELGRRGLASGISLLDVVQVHHDVLIQYISGPEEMQELADAASTFLAEVLASFEMAQRGFMEQRAAADAPPAPADLGGNDRRSS